MTPLVIQIVILFVKILAELLLIILVPAFALKFFKKDLSFGLAFSASILMILLPVLTYVNNAELNNTILPFCCMGCGFRADLILDDLGAVDRSHHLFFVCGLPHR